MSRLLQRLAIGFVAAFLAIGHATAGESRASAAASAWTWGAAGDDAALVAVPRSEARPARLNDAPPPVRLTWAALVALPALPPPPQFLFTAAGRASRAPAPVFASVHRPRGPPTVEDR